jgi:hypothetical protein
MRGPDSAGPRAEQKRVRDLLAQSRELLKLDASRLNRRLRCADRVPSGRKGPLPPALRQGHGRSPKPDLSLTGILLMAAITFYGFYTSLGGRPVFGAAVLED